MSRKSGKQLLDEMRYLAGMDSHLAEQEDEEDGEEEEGGDEEEMEDEEEEQGAGEGNGEIENVDDAIAALRDTEYADKEGYLEMVDLLGALADISDEDESASEFLSLVSEALYDAAVKILGEE